MRDSILSIFVDESGRFQYPDRDSRYYIVGMVLHDQNRDISDLAEQLNRNNEDLGLDSSKFVFHAGPLIRMERGYAFLSRKHRGKIFDRMMNFARRVDFKYHCLSVDKKFIGSSLQIVGRLKTQLQDFIQSNRSILSSCGHVKIYYDCGQSPVTNLLHETFADIGCPVEFAQGVKPVDYKLFQLADLICTLHLISEKLNHGELMSESENRFFGGPKDFKHNILRKLEPKRI